MQSGQTSLTILLTGKLTSRQLDLRFGSKQVGGWGVGGGGGQGDTCTCSCTCTCICTMYICTCTCTCNSCMCTCVHVYVPACTCTCTYMYVSHSCCTNTCCINVFMNLYTREFGIYFAQWCNSLHVQVFNDIYTTCTLSLYMYTVCM